MRRHYNNILSYIGDAPIVMLENLVPYDERYKIALWAKLEMFNPTGSVKDISALGMINAAEKEELLKKDSVIIESTSGNLGISLAMICSIKGYKFICVLDPKAEQGKINAMKAYGAEIVMVNEPDEEGGYQRPRIAKVKELLQKIPNSINLDQYNNPANPDAHYKITGLNLAYEFHFDDMGGIDVLVGAVSTGGHLCGTAKYLKERFPNIKVVGVEPNGSVLFGGKYRPYLQQGTGLSFQAGNYNPNVIDEKVKVSDEDAFRTARELARKEGILAGGSSGGVVYAAMEKIKEIHTKIENKTLEKNLEDKLKKGFMEGDTINVVAILPDHGDRYLSTVFCDDWLKEKGIKI